MILEIFKIGDHTSSNGKTKSYTIKDLDTIVDSYNPEEREAPLVLGHPKDNDPAYGWVEKLFRKGESLFAVTKNEDPAFLQAVKEKKFPKRSISLTEELKLNHIGFLGAMLPAVDGLSPVAFNVDDEFSVFEIENTDVEFDNSKFFSNKKEVNNGPSKDPAHQNTQNKDSLNKTKTNEPDDTAFKSYSKVLTSITDTLNQVKTLTEDFSKNFASATETELKDSERQKIREQLENLSMKIDVNNFEVMLNEKLIYGSITPLMKTKITKTLKFLNNQNFSKFNSDNFILELKTQLMEFINSIPKIIDYSEFATKPDDEPDNDLVDDNYDGLSIDESSNTLHKKVLLKMKEKDISYVSALKQITK